MDAIHVKIVRNSQDFFPIYTKVFLPNVPCNFQIQTEKKSQLFMTFFLCLSYKVIDVRNTCKDWEAVKVSLQLDGPSIF